MTKRCDNCFYSFEPKVNIYNILLCRRFPPNLHGEGDLTSSHSSVRLNGWCGEYKNEDIKNEK